MGLGETVRKGVYLLGKLLVGRGATDEGQVEHALREQQRLERQGSPRKRLGQLLVEMSAVTPSDVDQALREQRSAREQAAAPRPASPAAPTPAQGSPSPAEPAVMFVASKNGSAFHRTACIAARKINPANLQRFPSREAAEGSGHRPCPICCG